MHSVRLFSIMSFIVFDVASPLSGCNRTHNYNYIRFHGESVFYEGLNSFKEVEGETILNGYDDYISNYIAELDTTNINLPDGIPEAYKGYTFEGWYLMKHCPVSDYSSSFSINKKVEFPYTYTKEDLINTEFVTDSLIFAQRWTKNV
jgi:hypothetical protein